MTWASQFQFLSFNSRGFVVNDEVCPPPQLIQHIFGYFWCRSTSNHDMCRSRRTHNSWLDSACYNFLSRDEESINRRRGCLFCSVRFLSFFYCPSRAEEVVNWYKATSFSNSTLILTDCDQWIREGGRSAAGQDRSGMKISQFQNDDAVSGFSICE